MLEAGHVARRSGAITALAEGPVRTLAAASRFSLRVKGVAVPLPPRRGGPSRTEGPNRGGDTPVGSPRPGSASPTRPSPAGRENPFSLALPINRCATFGDRTIARLGPDEWLILGPEADTDAMAGEIGAVMAGRVHALVDISHRQVAFAVAGPGSADILNAGCPLDLHASAFPPGCATRTLLGKAEIILMRPGDEPVFQVECWRSFAAYVGGFLVEAARDL